MGGIVMELQREAMDESISIESLLRKAYLVSKKLKLKEFEEWIKQEQNGYSKEVPGYRNVAGELKAWNPYHGWVPVIFSGEVGEWASKMKLVHSISALSDVYNSSDNIIRLSISSAYSQWLDEHTDLVPTKYEFFVSKSELYRIMSTIRNKILDWALLLEDNGIIGEGMTFTDIEKKKALNTNVINNYTNNFYAEVSDIDMQQG